MNKIHIAFDVDGTLRKNSEEIHRTEIVENTEMITLLITLAKLTKNVTVHIWSNRGAEYCKRIRKEFRLEKYVKETNCHKKLWKAGQIKAVEANEDYFKPNIAIDDQQKFDGAFENIIVRLK